MNQLSVILIKKFFDVIIKKFLIEKIKFPNIELEINRITNEFKRLERISNVIMVVIY